MKEELNQSEIHKECVDIIDQLHVMAHNGCFKHLSIDILNKCRDILSEFLNVDITLDQASNHFGVDKRVISCKISRNIMSKDKTYPIKLFKFRFINKLFGK